MMKKSRPKSRKTMNPEEAKRAVITVGKGRGFVVQAGGNRLVVTAAHCLPSLPPAARFSPEDRTYFCLLGRLGEKPTIATECLFVDPVSDIAVLGSPDGEVLLDEADEYETLIESSASLQVSGVNRTQKAKLLSLDGRWLDCTVRSFGRFLRVFVAGGTAGGMSGSPILANSGAAIAVVSTGSVERLPDEQATPNTSGEGPNPVLDHNLPGWCLRDLSLALPRRKIIRMPPRLKL